MFKRGGVYLVNLVHDGDERMETCPSLVVSNNISNEYSPVVTIVPVSFSSMENIYEFETFLPASKTGLAQDAKISSHIIITIDKSRVVSERIGFVARPLMEQVEKALRLQLAL